MKWKGAVSGGIERLRIRDYGLEGTKKMRQMQF
jgi:hypothetical protein